MHTAPAKVTHQIRPLKPNLRGRGSSMNNLSLPEVLLSLEYFVSSKKADKTTTFPDNMGRTDVQKMKYSQSDRQSLKESPVM